MTDPIKLWYIKPMRALVNALLVCAFVLAGPLSQVVFAKSWKGVIPGKTNRQQVLEKFGKPTKEFSKGGRLSDGVNYKGEQAIEGSLEANFFFNKHDILFRVDVFPAREISRAQVIRIFGKDYQERVTRTKHTLFNYYKVGMVVFFEKNADIVLSFVFTEEPTGRRGGGKTR